LAKFLRDNRGRTTDSRPRSVELPPGGAIRAPGGMRGSMQEANLAYRRALAEERRQVEGDWTPPEAA
jgi:hypothetical protein